MALSATTKLQAINVLLTSIGEAPVSQEGSGLDEEALAADVIDETSRAVQLIGWSWNTEDNFPLNPDGDGYIYVPSSALKIDFQSPHYVVRGGQVYDKLNHTFVHKSGLRATLVVGLDWTDLSESVRSYVMYRAGRVFQSRQVSAQILHAFTKEDEDKAWIQLVTSEEEVANRSLFHNTELALMLDRSASFAPFDYMAGQVGGTIYD